MKKIISCLCMVLLLISTTSVSFASSIKSSSISPETVITEDNIYVVLDSLGINRNKFTKSEQLSASELTVGQLSEIIKNENMPTSQKPNNIETNEFNVDNGINIHSVNSVQPLNSTKYYYSQLGSVQMGVTATGEYTITPSDVVGHKTYTYKWTRALGASIFINSSNVGTTHRINSVSNCSTSIVGGYLRADYNATVESFVALKLGFLSLGERTFSGYHLWSVN